MYNMRDMDYDMGKPTRMHPRLCNGPLLLQNSGCNCHLGRGITKGTTIQMIIEL